MIQVPPLSFALNLLDNERMRVPFTKMHGAGNDFVIIDETRINYGLTPAQYRWIADRHFGVGADQILSVRPAPYAGVDFEYIIHNADGGEVEHCGNGARCFVRFVHDSGLSLKNPIRVKVHGGEIVLEAQADGRVKVDMGAPVFDPSLVPFNTNAASRVRLEDSQSLANKRFADPHYAVWLLDGIDPLACQLSSGQRAASLDTSYLCNTGQAGLAGDDAIGVHDTNDLPDSLAVSVLSMGNPHAVMVVRDVEQTPVARLGAWIERHPAFPSRVNAGFMQVLDRAAVRLRVFERGAGETLACGTGACAAVVAGIQRGLLDPCVSVQTRGGVLSVEWSPAEGAHVLMTGPAQSVFSASVEVGTLPSDAPL